MTTLHPQNARVGDAGLPIGEFLDYRRRPYLVVTNEGDQKHRTPLCPEVRGRVWRLIGAEDALYAYGENRCETCRLYNLSREETGWTDPRYCHKERDSA
jgi:hypothetical protein